MTKYVVLIHKDKLPRTVLLFGGFRYSLALSFLSLDFMSSVDKHGGKSVSLIGWYVPPDYKGLGITLWPLNAWILWKK
jgi:hypothetical protein